MNKEYEKNKSFELAESEVSAMEDEIVMAANIDELNEAIETIGGFPVFGNMNPDVLFVAESPRLNCDYSNEPYNRLVDYLDERIGSWAITHAWPKVNPGIHDTKQNMPISILDLRRLERSLKHQIRVLNPSIVVYMDMSIKFYKAFAIDNHEAFVDETYISYTNHKIFERWSTFIPSPINIIVGREVSHRVAIGIEHVASLWQETSGHRYNEAVTDQGKKWIVR